MKMDWSVGRLILTPFHLYDIISIIRRTDRSGMEERELSMRISLIGGGRMGEAMIRGILDKGVCTSGDIGVSDINTERCALLSHTYGVICVPSNREALSGADVVILAVKPQTLAEVMTELKGCLSPQQLLLSIVTGARISILSQGLEHKAVVRVVPNTPAQIGKGMSVWTASQQVNQEQKEAACSILKALGVEMYVDSEKYLDMATAVSGSGPAYILLIIEALIDAAVHIGFSRDMARLLVLQTVLGTTQLVQESDKHTAELRNMVTSPGGTTAEALLELEGGGLRAIIGQAVVAAYEKAKALAGG